MSFSLSSLVDNLSEINNKDCKKCMERKKSNSKCDYIKFKNNRLAYRCKECNDKSYRSINDLIKMFPNTYQFINKDLNKFILLLRKGVYPYDYMDSWKRLNETSLPDKKSFYNKLNLKDSTSRVYMHAQKVCEVFKIKNLGEYHDLYVQSDTILLADVFVSFRYKYLEIYKLDSAHFLSALRLSWMTCLKKARVKLELLTDNDMLMMFEKGIRGGICNAIYRYAKANNKYMKNYGKNIKPSFLMYLDANNLHGWEMLKKLPTGNFKWIQKHDPFKFNEEFIKHYDENSDKGYLFEVDVEYPKYLYKFHSDLPFLPERTKINNYSKLICHLQNKNNYILHINALKQALNNGLVL